MIAGASTRKWENRPVIDYLRTWWQSQTGEDETPFDGDTPAWLVSMVFHVVLLLIVALVPVLARRPMVDLTLSAPLEEEIEEELEVPQEFYHSPQITEAIGANSFDGVEMALSVAPEISEISDVVSPVEENSDIGDINVNDAIEISTGLNYNVNYAVKGSAGVGETGAAGAIDRITHEILLSLEERKTHVVWLFDQSGSLLPQREAILDRFDRIYEELGVIEASGNEAFAKHSDTPLLTSVMAFGQNITMRTSKPTDDLEEIKAAVADIEMDSSGTENIFTAIQLAVERSEGFRTIDPETGGPLRNVMVVAFCDEVGDDQRMLEKTIRECRKNAVPVYVVGVPAPFGRNKTLVKWIDPNPKYDQSPQWGEVTQGPESLMAERLNLHFSGSKEEKAPIDSGFGPFALTRLCYQTGGIYFAVHPNRHVGRSVSKDETAAMSAHFSHFFDPQIMRKYRPDYVSPDEYKRRLLENKCREALVRAAAMSWVGQLDQPRTRFVKRDEAALANDLSKAQEAAARLEPKINAVAEMLRQGEVDRAKEDVLRWQAGYDLAMGRALAVKARTQAYNELLAKARRGYKFEGKNNTLTLEATNQFDELTSAVAKSAEKAKIYLTRVIEEHPGTPWALLAKRELETPLAWRWEQSHTDLTPRERGGGGNGRAVGRDDKVKMLNKPKPKRRPPRL